jgi:HPt (histidine-containing phosphotransfer) domain-containing protein
MDDYVSKPVRPPQLLAALARFPPCSDSIPFENPDSTSRATPPSMEPPPLRSRRTDQPSKTEALPGSIDWKVALKSTFGDDQLLREVIEAYLEEAPHLTASLDTLLAAGNVTELTRIIHTIKGSFRTFGSEHTGCAQSLEAAAQAGQLDDVRARLPELHHCLARTEQDLRGYLSSGPSVATGVATGASATT